MPPSLRRAAGTRTGRAIRGLGFRRQTGGWGLFRQGIGLVALYWLLRSPTTVEQATAAVGRALGWLADPATTVK